MSKEAEVKYIKNIGKEGQDHAFNKPYSDENCGMYFIDIGSLFSLLPPPPLKLLDLGVGTGWTSVFFAKRGYDVTGQDIAEDMIALAKENKKRNLVSNLDFITSDFESLTFDGVFDCAIFNESLHHAVDHEKAMRAVYKALKPNGICLTLEPGKGHSKSSQSKHAIETWGTTEKDMSPNIIIAAAKKAGFLKTKVFLKITKPLEIFPVFSLPWLLNTGKFLLKSMPVFSNDRPNIVMLIK